jgi:hypothetical protein
MEVKISPCINSAKCMIFFAFPDDLFGDIMRAKLEKEYGKEEIKDGNN